MLNVTVLRGLGHTKQEVGSREVPVADFKHILDQSFGVALLQCEIGDLERDEARYDVNCHPDVPDISDPIGGIQDEAVVDFVGLHLHVLDVPAVNVLLGERLDRGLFVSDVPFLRFHKTPEKAMRGGRLDSEDDLRWQVVLVSDLQQSENIFSRQIPNVLCVTEVYFSFCSRCNTTSS